MVQLVNEAEVESKGERLGLREIEGVLDSHEVPESKGDSVLEAESVGPPRLPELMPDCEFEPDAVSDEVALEEENLERVAERVLHAVDDGLVDAETVVLPHAEKLELMDDVLHGDDDGEYDDVAQPLGELDALRDGEPDEESQSDELGLRE